MIQTIDPNFQSNIQVYQTFKNNESTPPKVEQERIFRKTSGFFLPEINQTNLKMDKFP